MNKISKRTEESNDSGRVCRGFTSRGRAFANGECILKKVECLSSKQGKITKQDKAQVVYELRNEFSVKALLQLADIPRSTYYYWVNTIGIPDRDAKLKDVKEISIQFRSIDDTVNRIISRGKFFDGKCVKDVEKDLHGRGLS